MGVSCCRIELLWTLVVKDVSCLSSVLSWKKVVQGGSDFSVPCRCYRSVFQIELVVKEVVYNGSKMSW